jgi:hypothetical protein
MRRPAAPCWSSAPSSSRMHAERRAAVIRCEVAKVCTPRACGMWAGGIRALPVSRAPCSDVASAGVSRPSVVFAERRRRWWRALAAQRAELDANRLSMPTHGVRPVSRAVRVHVAFGAAVGAPVMAMTARVFGRRRAAIRRAEVGGSFIAACVTPKCVCAWNANVRSVRRVAAGGARLLRSKWCDAARGGQGGAVAAGTHVGACAEFTRVPTRTRMSRFFHALRVRRGRHAVQVGSPTYFQGTWRFAVRAEAGGITLACCARFRTFRTGHA